jgi:PDZ domain-containing secreted protein/Zn-dependent protease/CBS domain-containing protein
MEPTFRLLRVRGIPVEAHWTGAVAFAVVTAVLARSVLPSDFPGLGSGTHLAMAVVAAGLLFASVVLHELAHAVAARREGMAVEGITLWLLGGASDGGGRARSPGQEFRVAASGPLVSLVLAGLFAAAAAGCRRLGWPEPVDGVVGYVARLNLLVAAFNLIPILPLDGGRILRSWLWRRQRDLLAATRSVSRAGQAFGLTLVVVGLLDLAGGAGLIGLWLGLLGAFVLRAATSELTDARTRHRLDRLTAADVMATDPGVVLADTPVTRLVESPPAPVRSGYPVLGGGRLQGVVALASARAVPAAERDGRLVVDVMTPLDDVPMVGAADPVLDVLDRLNGTNPIGQVVVVDDGRVVGILDEDDVAFALERPPAAISNGKGSAAGAGPNPTGTSAAGTRAAGTTAAGTKAAGPRPAGVAAWVLVGGLCLVVGAALYRPPYVVVMPGRVVDVSDDITLAGVPASPLTGRYQFTSVEFHRTSALGALVAAVRDGRSVVPAGRAHYLSDDGAAAEIRTTAAVAAARSQGLPATVAGTGVRVVAVRPRSPADGVLRVGDVVLAADGRPVTVATTLTELVQRLPAGTEVRLWVDRAGRVRETSVTTADEPGSAGGSGVGITVETRDLRANLPFEVQFSGRVGGGGPGSGLAYALAIADLLSPDDLARGRTIAAAGAIAVDGHVQGVGAMAPHAEAAAGSPASVLVIAQDEAEAARRTGLQVEGVESLARALEALSSTG